LRPPNNIAQPLDSDDDEQAATSSSSDEGPKKKRMRRTAEQPCVIPGWQQSFTCMQKHDGNLAKNNPNARTISILEQMLEHYERTSDQWRTIAYRKAISALRRENVQIVSKDQALRIPCIGERLASKIEEIVWTNRLRRLEYAKLEANDRILQMFLNIYGVGFAQASKWIAQGHRSLDDLRKKVDLTKNQQIGVEHYEDFLQRIPRAEVEAHGEVVRKSIHKVDPSVHAIIAGSYRRGASNSGDIDLLITKPGSSLDEIRSLMIDTVIPELSQQGFLKTSLASSFRSDSTKWHGASALPGDKIWRRIDLLFVPWDEIGAALIYFTGNDIFNRSLRLLASKKGMCLNQRGLFEDVLRGPNRVKMNAGRLLEGHDEKRIFELLGVPWRPPEHRIC
jgi:DNA polymerase IV